ncbi:Hypothetical protein, putative [Bodo saltans]|uniref:DNA-directed DNA polymerase X domain-containing protein n=1 Tax=Bodo saltans TaxID=75058 RepID=A0A0S4JIV7_BODSA|nr:Hypothetical protein, putative [Bodo saltans]|eukprot:CUG88930.1 Hypothetical protein, putative [Bodo saltans]
MFSKFHVFVLPGGPHLGKLQSDLLRNVVTQNGGVVEHDPFLLPSVATSLARRGRKKLVIVSGRDTVEQIEMDLLQAAVSIALGRGVSGDDASTRSADVVRQLRTLSSSSTTTTSSSGATVHSAPIPSVSFVSHLWISSAVTRKGSHHNNNNNTAAGTSSASAATSTHQEDEASTFAAGLLTSFRVGSANASSLGDYVSDDVAMPPASLSSSSPFKLPMDVADGDGDAKKSVVTVTPSKVVVASAASGGQVVPSLPGSSGGRGAGFLPVFFSSAPAAAAQGDDEIGASRRDHRERLIKQIHQQGKSVANVDSNTDEVVSDAHHPLSLKRSRSASYAEGPIIGHFYRSEQLRISGASSSSDGPSWQCSSVGDEHVSLDDAETSRTKIVIDPNDRSLVRQAAYIDKVKPFICQQQAPRGGGGVSSQAHASLFVDDDDDSIGEGVVDQRDQVDEEDFDPVVLGLLQKEMMPLTHRQQQTLLSPSAAAPEAPRVALNQPLLTQLAELKSVYEATGDQWRMYAYNKAIGVIKRVPFQVQRVEQLASYQGLGHRILNKVREILNTGTTTKLHVLRTTPHVAAMEAFSKIWGVGPSTARRLSTYAGGSVSGTTAATAAAVAGQPTRPLRTIDDLRCCSELEHLLSPQQLVGLRHYEDLEERIPREEVTALIAFVQESLKAVVGEKRAANIDVVACGSYRRRKATSGDVDILLCDHNHGSCSSTDGLLGRLVQQLKRPFRQQQLTDESSKKLLVMHSKTAAAFVDQPSSVKTYHDETQHASKMGVHMGQCSVRCKCSRRQHAFIVEDLTVSHRGLQEVHSDSWFGVVQLPDCCAATSTSSKEANAQDKVTKMEIKSGSGHENPSGTRCCCVHRKVDHAEEVVVEAMVGGQPSIGEAYTCGSHYSRRMDIKLYPPDQFAFALLYFTGSDYFNRSMRLFCQKRGWSLSDKDLKPVVRVRGEKVHETAHGVPCKTERDIFEAIGLPYKEPWERDV